MPLLLCCSGCCSVLQCVAVCCSVLRSAAMQSKTLLSYGGARRTITIAIVSKLQSIVAVCCSVLRSAPLPKLANCNLSKLLHVCVQSHLTLGMARNGVLKLGLQSAWSACPVHCCHRLSGSSVGMCQACHCLCRSNRTNV